MGNTQICIASVLRYIVDEKNIRKELARTWQTVDYDRFLYNNYRAHTMDMVAKDIDRYIDRAYDTFDLPVNVTISCESFLWSLIRLVSKRIDEIMAYGYDYVMHTWHMKAEFDSLVALYDYIQSSAKRLDVFVGNMH